MTVVVPNTTRYDIEALTILILKEKHLANVSILAMFDPNRS